MALHLSEVKLQRRKLVYVDVVRVKVDSASGDLVIGPPKDKPGSIYLLVAISKHDGMVGYQILTALPQSGQGLLDKL